MFRKIIGSPLRFFGFLSTLLFLLTAILRWSSDVFDSYFWYANLPTLGFIFTSITLYLIAVKTNDLKSKETFLSRIVGSPVKLLAFVLILLGTHIMIWLIAWVHFENTFIWLISGGVLLYIMEFVYSKQKTRKIVYWAFQTIALFFVGIIYFLFYLHSTAKTDFITSNEDEFIIIYEIEGYPPLPRTVFWRKKVKIPENGILITSSSMLELPGYRKNYFDYEGNNIIMNRKFNLEYCSDKMVVVSVDYFTPNNRISRIPCGLTEVQIAFQNIFDSICKGKIKSTLIDTTSQRFRDETREDWCEKYKKYIMEKK